MLCIAVCGLVPSVLWLCWNNIWPVKIEWWGVGVVICLERGADCLHIVQLMPLHPKTPSSLASLKSRLVLPFWYWLNQVVLEKRPLNGCSNNSIVWPGNLIEWIVYLSLYVCIYVQMEVLGVLVKRSHLRVKTRQNHAQGVHAAYVSLHWVTFVLTETSISNFSWWPKSET